MPCNYYELVLANGPNRGALGYLNKVSTKITWALVLAYSCHVQQLRMLRMQGFVSL
jgi:hypothetical protein